MCSDPTLCALAEMILSGWPEDIYDVPMDLCPYHHACDVLTVEDGIILHGEALVIPPLERGKVLQSIHEGHQGISKCQYCACQCIYWPGINQDIKCAVEACATCQHHHPQEPQQPLKPTPAPECPWQHLGADFMHFDGNKYLIVIDYYSKMPFVHKIPPSQCNAAKMISILKELFAEHGIPESLHMDNGPQFTSALFAEFATDWNFDHCTSAPTNPCSNGQVEAAMKIVKGLLTQSKYSGQDPYLALLAYCSTPMDAHMHSPGEMLYQCALCTTVPQHIHHTDPHATADCHHLDQHASLSAANHNHQGCQQKSPLFAGQSVSVLNDAKHLWLPATVIHAADHGSYIVQVIGSGQYQCARDHIHEHHPDAIKPHEHVTTNVAPATPTHPPATQVVQPAPCVAPAPATPQPAAIPHTPWKTTTVHTPPHAQSVTLKLTSAAPAVPCHSAQNSKPPFQLTEEM